MPLLSLVRAFDCASHPSDTFIQKTKKVYSDTKTQKNLSKVTEDLSDVHKIMTKNISEILGRGEKLNSTKITIDQYKFSITDHLHHVKSKKPRGFVDLTGCR